MTTIPRRIVIITGVAGSGKTTIGRALANQLQWQFCDADDLHSPESVERLRNNQPLDDEARWPWLHRVRAVVERASRERTAVVIACSALKRRYRHLLADGVDGVRFVFLTGDTALLRERLENRRGHFAGAALLESQLAELEPPTDALTIDVSVPVDAIVDRIIADLRSGGAKTQN